METEINILVEYIFSVSVCVVIAFLGLCFGAILRSFKVGAGVGND